MFSAHTLSECALFSKVICLEYLPAEYGPGCSVWCFLDFILFFAQCIHCLLYTKYECNHSQPLSMLHIQKITRHSTKKTILGILNFTFILKLRTAPLFSHISLQESHEHVRRQVETYVFDQHLDPFLNQHLINTQAHKLYIIYCSAYTRLQCTH